MADSPINLFGTEALTVPNNSYFGFDFWNGTSYETVKIKSQNLSGALGSSNMANSNQTQTGNRSHDGASNRWIHGKLKDFTIEGFIAPTPGLASINLNGFGSLSSDLTHRFSASGGLPIVELYGDRTTRFFSGIGINTPAIGGYAIFADGVTAGCYAQSTNGKGGVFNSVNGIAIEAGSVNSRGGVFTGKDYGTISVAEQFGAYAYATQPGGWGMFSYQNTGTAGAHYAVGNVLVEDLSTGSIHPSALFEVKSTTKGFMMPRMTGAQAEAINGGSPGEGLVVYATLGNGAVITTKGWWGYDGTTWRILN